MVQKSDKTTSYYRFNSISLKLACDWYWVWNGNLEESGCFPVIRKYSLMFFYFALLSCLTAQKFSYKTRQKRFNYPSVNLGPAVLPMSGIRFQYRINDFLSLNSGLSNMLATRDFNAVGNVHLCPWKLLILILTHVEYFYTTWLELWIYQQVLRGV